MQLWFKSKQHFPLYGNSLHCPVVSPVPPHPLCHCLPHRDCENKYAYRCVYMCSKSDLESRSCGDVALPETSSLKLKCCPLTLKMSSWHLMIDAPVFRIERFEPHPPDTNAVGCENEYADAVSASLYSALEMTSSCTSIQNDPWPLWKLRANFSCPHLGKVLHT